MADENEITQNTVEPVDMIGELCSILEQLGYPLYLQGSLDPNKQLPDSFFTYWSYSSPETAAYDNSSHQCIWGFWVYFYSVDPRIKDRVIECAHKALKASGWTPNGRPVDVGTNIQTHTGRMFGVQKIENYTEEE